jgi:alkylhydroperoxidase family enzyme
VLKAATLTSCEYCVDLGPRISRRSAIIDAQLLALPTYRDSDLFTGVERMVLDYATAMSRTLSRCRSRWWPNCGGNSATLRW